MAPKLPTRQPTSTRTGAFPLFPMLAALLLVLLAVQGLRLLANLNDISPTTTPRLPSNPNVFADVDRIHPKTTASMANLTPTRVVAPAFAHNIRQTNPEATHTLTLFTDPLCTPCRAQINRVLASLEAAQTPFHLVYKYWPENPNRVEGGLILKLAHQQGKGQTLINMLWQTNNPLAETDLFMLLDTAGLNLSVQRKLLAEKAIALAEQVGHDITQARELNLGPPPQLILNDMLMDGRILHAERLPLYLERLQNGQPLLQPRDYWLNAN